MNDYKDEKCTWDAFEFDYSNAEKIEEISCVSRSTLPGNEGGPDGVRSRGVTRNEWTLSLEPGDGYHIQPQYTVSRFSKDAETIDSDESVCSVGGDEIFRYRFTKMSPALTRERLEKALRHLMD